MYVSEETSWVGLDLLDIEVGASVCGGSGGVNTSTEGTLEAADGVGVLFITDWVGESNSG